MGGEREALRRGHVPLLSDYKKGCSTILKRNLAILAVFLLLDAAACYCLFPDFFHKNVPVLETLASSPTPSPPAATPPPQDWTLRAESADAILALAAYPSLKRIDARGSTEYDALLTLRERLPDCEIVWTYVYDGTSYPSDTTELRATTLQGLEKAIRYLPELTYVDLRGVEATVEDLDRLDAVRPGLFFDWCFDFGGAHIRTDIQVFSTLRSGYNYRYTDEDLYPLLTYCRRLRALDLGFNALSDLTPLGELRELEVLILAGNPITDASPLGSLEKLSYLEMQRCPKIRSFHFLKKLRAIREINLCYDQACINLDFLENMPDFSFGMFKFTDVDSDDFNAWVGRFPNASIIIRGSEDSTDCGWLETQRNHDIRYAFANWRHITAYRGVGDVDYDMTRNVY